MVYQEVAYMEPLANSFKNVHTYKTVSIMESMNVNL